VSYLDLLARVETEARRYGATVQPPCSEPNLDRLRARVQAELGCGLPAGHAELLRHADGLNWNGLYLHPSATAPIAGRPEHMLADVVACTLDFRATAGIADALVVGEDSLDVYLWRAHAERFQILDRVATSLVEQPRSFDALVTAALRRCLAQ
jgi:hypothetical protein